MGFLLNPFSFAANPYGTLTLLADYTVTGSAITSYTFSGLSLTPDVEYLLVTDILGVSGFAEAYLYVNGNTTSTNYYYQRMNVSGAYYNEYRSTSSPFRPSYSSDRGVAYVNLKLANSGYFIYKSQVTNRYSGANIEMELINGTSNFTSASITSVTVMASVASTIGVGSRFQLYQIGGAT